jgi:hypothetical protein
MNNQEWIPVSERLTRKSESGMTWFVDRENHDMELEPCEMSSHHNRVAIEKLADYEDAEEQGLLLRLPCKVGDTLYILQKVGRDKHEITEGIVKEFVYRPYTIPRLEIYFENLDGFESCLFDGTLNEDVFLTKSDAEQALEEMRNV